MHTDYDTIAAEYKQAKQQPWRLHIEHFTLFQLIGDLSGKTVLDLACGEGFYTRFLKLHGAAKVVGIDLSERMIELARAEETRHPLGIEYRVQDAKQVDEKQSVDLVAAGWLLNYASTRDELLAMCQAIGRSLKPGCRFVTVNNNPTPPTGLAVSYRKYGFERILPSPLAEGAPVVWRIFLDGGSFDITNYQLSIATHESAFRASGFREVRWHGPRLSPAGAAEFGAEFWADFLEQSPAIFIECVK